MPNGTPAVNDRLVGYILAARLLREREKVIVGGAEVTQANISEVHGVYAMCKIRWVEMVRALDPDSSAHDCAHEPVPEEARHLLAGMAVCWYEFTNAVSRLPKERKTLVAHVETFRKLVDDRARAAVTEYNYAIHDDNYQRQSAHSSTPLKKQSVVGAIARFPLDPDTAVRAGKRERPGPGDVMRRLQIQSGSGQLPAECPVKAARSETSKHTPLSTAEGEAADIWAVVKSLALEEEATALLAEGTINPGLPKAP